MPNTKTIKKVKKIKAWAVLDIAGDIRQTYEKIGDAIYLDTPTMLMVFKEENTGLKYGPVVPVEITIKS